MENAPARRTELRFVPDRRYTVLAGAGVLVAAVIAVATSDVAGRVLAATAAAVLAVYVVCDLVFTPRVLVTADAVVVNSPFVRARLPWAEVADVRADTRLRLGLRSTTLEIDAGPVLAVLSRRAIGVDPEAAAQLIRALRPRQ